LFFTKDKSRKEEVITMSKVYDTEPVNSIIDEIREGIPEVRRKSAWRIFKNVIRNGSRDPSEFMEFFKIDYHFEETPYDPDNPTKKGYWTNRGDKGRIESVLDRVFESYPHIHTWLRECVTSNGELNPDDPRTYQEYKEAFDITRFSDSLYGAPRMAGHDDIGDVGQGKGPVNRMYKQRRASETTRNQ
jgi:hypothetical protein